MTAPRSPGTSADPADPRPPLPAEAVRIDPDLARDLRRRVLRPLTPPTAPLPGDQVADPVHFAVLDGTGRPISTCFIFLDPYPEPAELPEDGLLDLTAWHLRQMATEPEARGRGAGAAVMRAVGRHIGDQGGGLLWCNARESALGFYRGQGLRSEGPIRAQGDPPIPHQRMWRRIPPAR